MPQIFVNNFKTTLLSSLGSGDTTMYLVGTSLLDAVSDKLSSNNTLDYPFFYLTISDESNIEIVLASGVPSVESGGCSVSIERGKEGTTPASFAAGTTVELRLTARSAEQMVNGFCNVGVTKPVTLSIRQNSTAVNAGELYYTEDGGNHYLLECTIPGTTDTTPPTSLGTYITDGTAGFIVKQINGVASVGVTDHFGDNVEYINLIGRSIGISSTDNSLTPFGTDPTNNAIEGAYNLRAIGIGGSAYAQDSVAIGPVKNTVEYSFMQAGLPIIPSGTQTASLISEYNHLGGCGSQAILTSKTFNFLDTTYLEIELPTNTLFYVDEVGVMFTYLDESLTTLPTISFGNGDGPTELVASTLLTGTITSGSRRVFTPLTLDGASILSATIDTAATSIGTLALGRFYFKGIFVAPESIVVSGGGG